jgi:UDP-N-acetylglucosamine--N-acetylmuramyl-(pentapeptide) pyrophosphoryl-undecaprenol N-acetylglucosamine transferase
MGTAAGKPLVLHDSKAVAGLATRVLAHGADRILLGFPQALRGRHAKIVEWVGNPMRDAICALPPPPSALPAAKVRCACWSSAEVSGAKRSTKSFRRRSRACPGDARPLIVHQAGEKHVAALRDAYAKHAVDAECVAFIDDMASRYAWADFVICRGGALTISELAAVGLGALVVPLPGAIADEQSANARFLVDAQAAWMEPQPALTAERLAERLQSLDRARALAMAQAAHAQGKRDAAARVADVCIDSGNAREAQGQARALRGHRRRRHERHRRGARHARVRRVRLRSLRKRGNATSREAGATVCIGHRAENVAKADAVVVSTAVTADNPEVVARASAAFPWCRAR